MTGGELSKEFFEAVISNNASRTAIILNLTFVEDSVPQPIRIDINAIDPISGMTALGLAAKLQNLNVLDVLLQRGADPLARDARGMIPSQMIDGFVDDHYFEMKRMLDAATKKPAPNETGQAQKIFERNIERLDKIIGGKRRTSTK